MCAVPQRGGKAEHEGCFKGHEEILFLNEYFEVQACIFGFFIFERARAPRQSSCWY